MKMNFILNAIRLFLGTFFILLTMPYITRVLGSEKLGNIEYANSIISYFLLFTALGIPSYGVREVSKVRNDEKKLSKLVLELLIILGITTIIGYILFFIFINSISYFMTNKYLLMIIGSNLLFTNIGAEWFYQGVENQIYITIRFIIVRVLGLILIFLLIKSPQDYYVYAGVLVLMSSGSSIFNFINLRKYIKFKGVGKINLRKHIKPILTIFIASLAVSIYLQLDGVMIGSIIGTNYVAYYSVANKLIRLVIVIVTALGSVMIPRLSNCLKNQDIKGYKNYANISLKYILFVSIPLMIAILLLAKEIIYIMAGEQFVESILTMQIMSIVVVVVGLAYFIGFQILYPYNLERYYTYSVIAAAIINFIFNYIFIPKFYQNGAAIGTVLAELIGFLMMLYFARKKLKELKFYNKENLKYVLASSVMGVIIIFLKRLNLLAIETLIFSIILGGASYIIILLILKEYFVIEGIKILKSKLKRGGA